MDTQDNSIYTVQQIQQILSEIAKSITSLLDADHITKAIMEQIEILFEPSNWSLFKVDSQKKELYFATAKGIDIAKVADVRIKLGEGIVGHVAETREPVLITDISKETRFTNKIDKLTGFKTRSIIAVPITYANQLYGVIELINAVDKRAFTTIEVSLLNTIADFAAIALNNAVLHEQMVTLANRDQLTGLYNRTYLDKLIYTCNQVVGNQRANDSTYCVTAWIDIDKFKQVNDRYNHSKGDEILVRLSDFLKTYCRNQDYAFRIGGDEFLLVFTNLKEQHINAVMMRIDKNLAEASTQLAPCPGISYGIAYGPQSQIQQIILSADKLMYINKESKARELVAE